MKEEKEPTMEIVAYCKKCGSKTIAKFKLVKIDEKFEKGENETKRNL